MYMAQRQHSTHHITWPVSPVMCEDGIKQNDNANNKGRKRKRRECRHEEEEEDNDREIERDVRHPCEITK